MVFLMANNHYNNNRVHAHVSFYFQSIFFIELAVDSVSNAASPTFAPSSHVPEPIYKFLSFFYRKFTEKNVYELFMLYENSFRKLSDKFYAKESWPSVDLIAGIFNQDPIFLALYRELYYRHIHTRLQPTNEQRVDSFKNYQQLFQLLLGIH